jgi:protein O-mannosyl-transferase
MTPSVRAGQAVVLSVLCAMGFAGCSFFQESPKQASVKQAPAAEQKNFASMTPEQWLNLSLAYYQQQRYLESIAAAQTAAYLKPDYAEAHNNIGAAYAALHLWDLAIQADQQALRIKPDYQLGRSNLAWALEQKRLGVR